MSVSPLRGWFSFSHLTRGSTTPIRATPARLEGPGTPRANFIAAASWLVRLLAVHFLEWKFSTAATTHFDGLRADGVLVPKVPHACQYHGQAQSIAASITSWSRTEPPG